MISNTSREFLSWFLAQNNNKTSDVFFLSTDKVPKKFSELIWDILDELEENDVAKNVNKFGMMDKQQCSFFLSPYAIDVVKEWKPENSDTIFARFKDQADTRLRTISPTIIDKLSSVYENMDSENPEDWANAVHSCRRILADLADVLYPPKEESIYINGKKIDVGKDKYINRLIQFIASKEDSDTYKQIVGTDLSSIGNRLDAIYNAVCKGTHTEITKDEALRIIIHTYLLISDIVALID